MNSTELFADHLRIASIYAYDWHDDNGDRKTAYGEMTLINGGGSWGTTLEVHVGDPTAKFKGPVVGNKAVDVTGIEEYRLDTMDLADGRYEAKPVALDAAGKAGTATAAVVVANAASLVWIAAAVGIAGGLAAGAAGTWTVAKKRSGKS